MRKISKRRRSAVLLACGAASIGGASLLASKAHHAVFAGVTIALQLMMIGAALWLLRRAVREEGCGSRQR
jgi:hypothetical protein